MKHLKKISISNARRFGKDVEIDLCSGANIFLAPNGTGKTTLFEAIEFALTGSIQRLVNPPLSLIRDKQSGVDVRLDFDNGQYCQVNYRKGEEPTISGHHLSLFPKHTIKDVPFLLRLTHLIEQRGNNWFIQKDESLKAGDLLDKLSIGKDLSVIAKTKSNTLNAATRTINDKKEQRDKHNQEVSSLENKIRERDVAKLTYILKPLSEIYDQLRGIHIQFSEPADDNSVQTIDSIISYRGVVNSIITKSKEDNEQYLLKLSNLGGKIPLFLENNIAINEKIKQVNEKKNEASKADINLESGKKELATLQLGLNNTKDIQKGLLKLKELLNKRNEEEAKSKAIRTSIELASDSIPEQTEKLRIENELLEKLNLDFLRYNSVRQSETEALRKQGEFASLQTTVDQWYTYSARLEDAKIVISNLIPEQEGIQKRIDEYQIEFTRSQELLNESQSKLSSIRNASDKITNAVGIISANLSKDRRKCPVCNAEYDAEELRNQIAIALLQIDPVIAKEIEENKALEQIVEEKIIQIQAAKLELSGVVRKLAEAEEQVKTSQAFINEKCIPRFSDKNNVIEADSWLKIEKEKIELDLKRILNEKGAYVQEPSFEELSKLTASRDNIRNIIQSNQANIGALTASLENSMNEIQKINQSLIASDTENLDLRIVDIEKEVEIATSELTVKSRSQEQIERGKRETDSEIIDLNMAVSRLQGQQNEILEQWKDCDLSESPSLENLVSKRDEFMKQAVLIRQSLAELNKLSEELGRWTAAEKLEILNREIKEICNSQDENEYLTNKKGELIQLDQELAFITERKAALDDLYRNIADEVNGVHQKIKAINPLWVSLLKKIVVNPRFVDTHLNSYSHYNKSHAEVKISLHDSQVSVMDVASEAQATDLQLTFMLSMASSYKWTPWKSLLLDDPTQHHDLVHASGVFDLLRDYITGQDFQILMGTHDTVQGKFFQRKLQNENVDVRLWRLLANEDGVRAEIIS